MSFPITPLKTTFLKDRGLLFTRGLSCLKLEPGGQRAVPFYRSRRVCRNLMRRLHQCPRLDRPNGILWPTNEYAVELRLAAALPAAISLKAPLVICTQLC